MRYLALLLTLTACGSAGEMFTDAGKCVSGGSECHQDPVPGPTGAPGVPGRDGQVGPQGPKGSSCTVSRITNGATITCSDGTTVLILDGENGQDGQPAPPTAYTVVEIVDPCGDAPGVFDEVFLRLANGTLVASFSENANGKNTRFAILTPGSYTTTDGSSCYFSVDSDNQVYNQHY